MRATLTGCGERDDRHATPAPTPSYGSRRVRRSGAGGCVAEPRGARLASIATAKKADPKTTSAHLIPIG
jgi:hypothetical protein